jgi:hypothetical protein
MPVTALSRRKGEVMPRTLLLALIATAVTACNKSRSAHDAHAGDNIRKLPLHDRSAETRRVEQAVAADAAATR